MLQACETVTKEVRTAANNQKATEGSNRANQAVLGEPIAEPEGHAALQVYSLTMSVT